MSRTYTCDETHELADVMYGMLDEIDELGKRVDALEKQLKQFGECVRCLLGLTNADLDVCMEECEPLPWGDLD
jgi:hypothetical protein